MKLALTINGTQITLPVDIQALNDKAADNFGEKIIALGINVLLFGIAITALFFIIFAGIKWITSSGDSKQIESARQTLIYAVIGLAVAFFSFLIVSVLGAFLKVPLINP